MGSRTLNMKQAVVIAAIFEFGGALLLGRVIQETISGGIADLSAFTTEPEIFAYGMMCALFVGGVWQIVASHFELNVSATHSIIGAIVGFTLVYAGADAVQWARKAPHVPGERRPFPPVKGVVPIVLSWFVSPVLTAAASALIFCLCRTLVLRRSRAFKLSFLVLPALVALTVFVNGAHGLFCCCKPTTHRFVASDAARAAICAVYFVLVKGAAKTLKATAGWTDSKKAWIAGATAAGCTLVTAAVLVPALWSRIAALERRAEEAARERKLDEAARKVRDVNVEDVDAVAVDVEASLAAPRRRGCWAALVRLGGCLRHNKSLHSIQRAAMHGVNVDIHAVVEEDPIVGAIHANAEVFDPKAEQVFAYLQVLSAICVIFAHGAAEVGYMSGPLGAIWQVVETGRLQKKVANPIWVLLLSAFGLVFGLATYGYNITRAVGTRMAKLTPSRGFAAELATSLVILVASQYGLPTSSSQCITGGVVGVALCEGVCGLNWRFFARTFASWVMTVVLVAIITAAVFAQAVFAPSVQAGDALREYEIGLTCAAGGVLDGYTAALRGSGYDTAAVGTDAFARSLATTRSNVAALRNAQTVKPAQLLGYLDTSLALYQPALSLNYSAEHVCPAAPAAPPCTLPPAPGAIALITPLQYGVTTAPLDARKQGADTCTRTPCNQ